MSGSVTFNDSFGLRINGGDSGSGTTGCSWIFSQNGDLGLSLFLHQASTNTYSPTVGFTVNTIGNIGIGTTSPSADLEISSTGVTTLKIQGDSANNAAFDDGRTQCQLQFRTEGGFDNGFDLNTQNWAGSSSFMINEVRGSTGSVNTFTRLCIDTSGNVGIGTTSPLYKLQVDGEVALNIMSGIGTTGSIKIGRQDFNARWHMINVNTGTSASLSNMIFNLHDATTSTTVAPVLALRGDGHVGITTTAPATSLHVFDSDPIVRIQHNSGATSVNSGTLELVQSNLTGVRLRYDGASDLFIMQHLTSGVTQANGVFTSDGGNIGIRTSAPSTALDVNGSIKHLGGYAVFGLSTTGYANGTSVLQFGNTQFSSRITNNTTSFTFQDAGIFMIHVKLNSDSTITSNIQLVCQYFNGTSWINYQHSENTSAHTGTTEFITHFMVEASANQQWRISITQGSGSTWNFSTDSANGTYWSRLMIYKVA
jgi:hypothetical protein